MFDFDILGFKLDLFLICLLYLLPGFALLGFTLFDAALLNFTVVCCGSSGDQDQEQNMNRNKSEPEENTSVSSQAPTYSLTALA